MFSHRTRNNYEKPSRRRGGRSTKKTRKGCQVSRDSSGPSYFDAVLTDLTLTLSQEGSGVRLLFSIAIVKVVFAVSFGRWGS